MARLPQPGSDDGVWGDILNDFLRVSHDDDGTLKDSSVQTDNLATGSVTVDKIAALAPATNQVLTFSGNGLAWTNKSQPGVTDHGDLTGLGDDDHTQYHNDARGDARYYLKAQADSLLAVKVDTSDPRLSDDRNPLDNSVTSFKLADGSVSADKLIVTNAPQTGQILSYDGSNLDWVSSAGGGGVTDHGLLSGLGDDDHTQYHNDARGDARYYIKGQVDTLLTNKVNSNDSRLSDQRVPLDNSVDASKLIAAAAPTNGQVLSYDGSQFNWINSASGVTDHGLLSGLGDDDHTQYHNDARGDARYYIKGQVDTLLTNKVNSNDSRLSDQRVPTDSSVTTAKLVDDSVTVDKLSTVVGPSNGQFLSYTGGALQWTTPTGGASDPTLGGDLTGTASSAQIAAGAVGANELATNAVSTAKIVDANVTSAKLATGAVLTGKLANSSVTPLKLVVAAAPTLGQILTYDGTGFSWSSPSSVPTTLDDLSDVTTTGATDGQSLVYQSGTWQPVTITAGGGVTDHGALTGLGDDDHTQYLNVARGDARYYTQAQSDASLAGKVDNSDTRLGDMRVPTDNSVSAAKLQAGSVGTVALADGSVSTAKLQASAVTTAILAANSVSTAKIQNASVSQDKLFVTNSPSANQVLGYTAGGLVWVTPAPGGATAASGVSYSPSGAIAAGNNTVQLAIDDLESRKAVDGAVVHKTGTESIGGVKNFSSTPQVGGVDLALSTDTRFTNNRTPLNTSVTAAKLVTTPAVPSANQILSYNGTSLAWIAPGGGAASGVSYSPSGAIAAGNNTVQLAIDDLESRKAVDGAVVHKTGTESIGGVKTFSGAVTFNSTPQVNSQAIILANDTRLSDTRTPTDRTVTPLKLDTSNTVAQDKLLSYNGTKLTWVDPSAGGGGGAASSITYSPSGVSGDITATNVQTAIRALDAAKSDTAHTHAASTLTGMLSLAQVPAGTTITVSDNASFVYPNRPTNRTDITVIWKGRDDPGSKALPGDEWKVVA